LARATLLETIEVFLIACHFTVGTAGSEIATAALDAIDEQNERTTADLLLEGVATILGRSHAEAVPMLRQVGDAAGHGDISRDDMTRWFHFWVLAATELWDHEMYRTALERLERAAREQGALIALKLALLGLATYETRAGRFAAAAALYDEHREIAIASGGFMEPFALLDGELTAWRGQDLETRAKTAALEKISKMVGSAPAVFMSHLGLAVLELAQGHYAEAATALRPVADSGVPGWAVQAMPNLIEAAVRSDDRATAALALKELDLRASAAGTPWALGLLARSRALLADDDDADELYQEAIAQLVLTPWTTDQARSHLLYGEWLRRQKRRLDAREHLRTAHEIFAAMGAEAFAERARIELLATGERARTRQVDSANDLTPREIQIAQLAAQRATSREIAAQLFISANTVDYHLRKVFRKLDVSSRRELAALMPAVDP
jgi:DNA-binding CsgD family transcriptional regulator